MRGSGRGEGGADGISVVDDLDELGEQPVAIRRRRSGLRRERRAGDPEIGSDPRLLLAQDLRRHELRLTHDELERRLALAPSFVSSERAKAAAAGKR